MKNFAGKLVEKLETHFVFCNFFLENRAVCELTWKIYCSAGQDTEDNMAHAHCMMDT
jgi:hypothetical protein